MAISDERVKYPTYRVVENFRCFGGGVSKAPRGNPIAIARANKPAEFAAGVSVEEVVRFILDQEAGEGEA